MQVVYLLQPEHECQTKKTKGVKPQRKEIRN